MGLGVALFAGTACAGPVLRSGFGAADDEAAAFVLAGGREAVTLGVAGKNLDQARLVGAAEAASAPVADPVSRLVVFRASRVLGEGLPLASAAPGAGELREAGGGATHAIRERVEQVGGRYLPFTLLRLTAPGAPPKPGTPLLDAGGNVAAVAHQPAGGREFYALPVEVVRRVVEDARDGAVSKAWIGIVLKPESRSNRVERVVAGSPAAAAGARPGDVITEVGGRRVDDYGDAVNAFYLLRPGAAVKMKVRRGSAEVMLDLTPRVAGS